MKSGLHAVFCAFCRQPRRRESRRSIGLAHLGLCASAAFFLSFVIFQEIDPRGILIFCVFFILTEIFVRLRWRLAVACPYCHFDAITYKKDPSRALQQVKTRLEEVKSDPEMAFSPRNPYKTLPKLKVKKETQEWLETQRVALKALEASRSGGAPAELGPAGDVPGVPTPAGDDPYAALPEV